MDKDESIYFYNQRYLHDCMYLVYIFMTYCSYKYDKDFSKNQFVLKIGK